MSCCCNAYEYCRFCLLSVVVLFIRACVCVWVCKKRELSLFDDGVVGVGSGFGVHMQARTKKKSTKKKDRRETRLSRTEEKESRASSGHTEPKGCLSVCVCMPVSASAEMGGKE